ncbi:MAG: MarR family transcriptional regulator [Ilumatobacteraceae bacterium]
MRGREQHGARLSWRSIYCLHVHYLKVEHLDVNRFEIACRMKGKPPRPDMVDAMVGQWGVVRPDLDSSPLHVIGRVSRLSRLIDRRLAENFAAFGLENWMYDVLATLRRHGAPYELTAGELVGQSMVTTGAITNRIDRLAERGLVERASASDRRKVIVRLTRRGLELVDEVVEAHLSTERQILDGLTDRQRADLAALLRVPLLTLGDGAS